MRHLNRTEEEKQLLATELCETLNDLVRTDPEVMHALLETREVCNEAMVNHPTAQVSVQDGQFPQLGLLGILNGLVGVGSDGWGYIAGCYDDTTNKLTGFLPTHDTRVKKSRAVDDIWDNSNPVSTKDPQPQAPAAEGEGPREPHGDK